MSNFLWWRSWHGAPTDHKWSVIAARAGVKPILVSAVAWALLDHASQQKARGDVSNFDTETYAVWSGIPESEVQAIINAMTDKQIIVNGRLSHWEERQPKREDNSTPRVQSFREKHNETQVNTTMEYETLVPAALSQETRAERVYRLVTGQPTFPVSAANACIDAITALTRTYKGEDDLVDYLRSWWGWWIAQRSKAGTKYSKTNTTWLTEKALACEPPPAVIAAVVESKEEKKARMARQLEQTQ